MSAQGQDAAQGSRSGDCLPQAINKPPILKHTNPAKEPSKYQISCCIDSVYYDQGDTCAVLLEVGFHLTCIPREHFISALLPTRVLDNRLDRFPEGDELVKMDEYSVKATFTLCPNIQVAGSGGTFGSISRETDRVAYKCLYLRSPKNNSQEEIHWKFENEESRHFPSAVKLLLLVRGGSGSGNSNFPFKLELLPTLEVLIKRRWWHVFKTPLQPRTTDGWSCNIDNNYFPQRAKDALHEHKKPLKDRKASQMVGLHGAMGSYLHEFRNINE